MPPPPTNAPTAAPPGAPWDEALFAKVQGIAKEEFRKPDCYKKQFESMAKGAARASGGAKAFTPKDLELFAASEFQQWSCFRGYDKVTTSNKHGELPGWNDDGRLDGIIAKLSEK